MLLKDGKERLKITTIRDIVCSKFWLPNVPKERFPLALKYMWNNIYSIVYLTLRVFKISFPLAADCDVAGKLHEGL